jgi:XTP/dITP diphosphohydrolase
MEDTSASLARFGQAVLVTASGLKAAEITSQLGRAMPTVSLDIAEIQALDVAEVSRHKAITAQSMLKRPVLVDDSGIEIDAWGGFPGALTRVFFDRVGPAGLLRIMVGVENRTARTVSALTYCDSGRCRTFRGEVLGTIAEESHAPSTFGYEGVFVSATRHDTGQPDHAAPIAPGTSRALATAKLRAALEDEGV